MTQIREPYNSKPDNSGEEIVKTIKKRAYKIPVVLGGMAIGAYLIIGGLTNSWKPGDVIKFIRTGESEKMRYTQRVDSIFNNSLKNYGDSVEFYKKYGLPVILPAPSFQQKESVVEKIIKESDFVKGSK